MHEEARQGFKWALEASGLQLTPGLTVLDIGGQDVNGTVHDLLPGCRITTLDLENADIIADARTWLPDRYFDVVIATEVFEHIADWRAVLLTMAVALEPAGPGVLLATCASTGRKPHGATGEPLPALGEHYGNVSSLHLEEALSGLFSESEVRHRMPPGDAYMWARL